MAKYRVIKLNVLYDAYHVQKQNWLTRKWHTLSTWSMESSALFQYSELTGEDFPNQEVIIESK